MASLGEHFEQWNTLLVKGGGEFQAAPAVVPLKYLPCLKSIMQTDFSSKSAPNSIFQNVFVGMNFKFLSKYSLIRKWFVLFHGVNSIKF